MAERKAKRSGQHPSSYRLRPDVKPEEDIEHSQVRQRHTENLLQGHPSPTRSSSERSDDSLYGSSQNASSTASETYAAVGPSHGSWNSCERIPTPETPVPLPTPDVLGPPSVTESSRSAFINSTQKVPTLGQFRAIQLASAVQGFEENVMKDVHRLSTNGYEARKTWADGSDDEFDSAESTTTLNLSNNRMGPIDTMHADCVDDSANENMPMQGRDSLHDMNLDNPWTTETPSSKDSKVPSSSENDRPDNITDTVGAIAVDKWGQIACGASSGGIGMKYRGRVGPAALVGVGAAVIPRDPDDKEQASVATVTSGTGEHMATTMAATTCAERLYQSVKKNKGGEYAEVTEDEALKLMIENEFMGHASVKNSNSAGAIGILGLKKTRTGIFLFYGHNTDSFALASMSSDDDVPKCTMSRSTGNGSVAQGGRVMTYRSRKRTKVTPRQRQTG